MISMVAAIDECRGLGKDNKLLFQIPEDLARFKRMTMGHPVIMGRKTYAAIGRPLLGRLNIVITRNKNLAIPSVANLKVCYRLNEAIGLAQQNDQKEIFIIGGGQIYQQAIGLADKLYLTLVKGKYGADTFFPEYSQFKQVIFCQKGQNSQYQYTFLELIK